MPWGGLAWCRAVSSTFSPAASMAPSSWSRVRRPRCSARSERTSQPSPPGSRWSESSFRNRNSIRLPGSYTALSREECGVAGIHGGLHTMSGARPGGNMSVRTASARSWTPRFRKFSWRRQSRGVRCRSPPHVGRRGGPERRRARRCRADVERQRVGRQRSGGHQVDVLAAGREERAVVRMDAALQGLDVDAVLSPLVGADCPDKLVEGHHRRFADVPVGFRGGLPGCPGNAAAAPPGPDQAGSAAGRACARGASGTGGAGRTHRPGCPRPFSSRYPAAGPWR